MVSPAWNLANYCGSDGNTNLNTFSHANFKLLYIYAGSFCDTNGIVDAITNGDGKLFHIHTCANGYQYPRWASVNNNISVDDDYGYTTIRDADVSTLIR